MAEDEIGRTEETAEKYGLTHDDMIGIICGLKPEEFYCVMPGAKITRDGFEDKTYVFIAKRRLKPVGEDREEDVALYIAYDDFIVMPISSSFAWTVLEKVGITF